MYSFIHSFACTHKGRVQEGKGRDGRITLCKISFVPLRNIWITSPWIDNQDSSIVALSIPSNHTSKLIKCILFSRLWVWAFCWRFSTVAQFWHADRKIKTALGRDGVDTENQVLVSANPPDICCLEDRNSGHGYVPLLCPGRRVLSDIRPVVRSKI